ncbi:MAG TPA: hypothetical protein VKG44_11665, partial [Candidatus Baltobacteraceae bacterium]|nr:hypothetical protein [Candidatus Baltobacteraceae bacterium]
MTSLAPAPCFSPSDLVAFLTCAHLTSLDRLVAQGALTEPAPSEEERLVAAKGQAHERAYLAQLAERDAGVAAPPGIAQAGREAAASATLALMRAGVAVIHGATLYDGASIGVPDFLVRVEGASALGDWHYEAKDAKLARSTKAATLIQLCAYSELLERLQDRAPERMHAILGDGREESYRCADFMAYY